MGKLSSFLLQKLKPYIQEGKELEKVEFKRELDLKSSKGKAEFAKDVSAIANTPDIPPYNTPDTGGYIIYGIIDIQEREKMGGDYVQGLPSSRLPADKTEARMVQILSCYCTPPPRISYCEILGPMRAKTIGILKIHTSREAKPHMIAKDGPSVRKNSIFIRRGTTSDLANREEIENMYKEKTLRNKLIVVSFMTHPVTETILRKIEEATQKSVETFIDVPTQLDEAHPFGPQISNLVEFARLSNLEWQQALLLLPGFSPAAALLLAELHGKIGHFPSIARLKRIPESDPPAYEVAEVVNLQEIRDSIRSLR